MVHPRQHDQPCARDALSHVARALDGNELLGAVQDQGRHTEGRQEFPDVGFKDHVDEGLCHLWTGGRALEDAASDSVALAVCARGHVRERAPLTPMLGCRAHSLNPVDPALPTRVVVGVKSPVRESAAEEQSACALGVSRREQDAHGPTLRKAEQRGALRAGRIHHGAHVVHAILQRRRGGDGV